MSQQWRIDIEALQDIEPMLVYRDELEMYQICRPGVGAALTSEGSPPPPYSIAAGGQDSILQIDHVKPDDYQKIDDAVKEVGGSLLSTVVNQIVCIPSSHHRTYSLTTHADLHTS